jgi:hypothetical protein
MSERGEKWKVPFFGGLVVALVGAIGTLSFADAAVSAVFPHGTGMTIEAGLFLASCGAFVVGAIAVVVGVVGWFLISD